MSADKLVFFVIGAVFFGFIALRPKTVMWLLSYGKPNRVPHGAAKVFQIMACLGLLLLGVNIIFDLVQGHY
jgi:hypothetical protein